MDCKLYKWSGAGNLFVVLDGRDMAGEIPVAEIRRLCAEHGTDGLMILRNSREQDFAMEFYNPDGSSGMMCGNGGRCITAFAWYIGVPGRLSQLSAPGRLDILGDVSRSLTDCSGAAICYSFEAPDGIHTAAILSHESETLWTVRLGMVDVSGIEPILGGYFLNTGTRHFVKFVPDVEKVDVDLEGRLLRWRQEFAPEGSNVNFVSEAADGLHVRTFEKGVEGETAACGTGLTASAIAAFHAGISPTEAAANGRVKYLLHARQAVLSVDFLPKEKDAFEGVFLTGPAELLTL